MEIDDELRGLMRRAEAVFGEAECSAAMDRAIARVHRERRDAAAAADGDARTASSSLPSGTFEAALKAELTRMLRPQ